MLAAALVYIQSSNTHLYVPLGAGSAHRSMLVVMLNGSTTCAQSSKLCRPTSTGRARKAWTDTLTYVAAASLICVQRCPNADA